MRTMKIFHVAALLLVSAYVIRGQTITTANQNETTLTQNDETTMAPQVPSQHVYDLPSRRRGECMPNPHLCYYCSKLHNCAECIQDPDNCCYRPDYRSNERGLTFKAIKLIKRLCSKPMPSEQLIQKHCINRMHLNPFAKFSKKKSLRFSHFADDENTSTLGTNNADSSSTSMAPETTVETSSDVTTELPTTTSTLMAESTVGASETTETSTLESDVSSTSVAPEAGVETTELPTTATMMAENADDASEAAETSNSTGVSSTSMAPETELETSTSSTLMAERSVGVSESTESEEVTTTPALQESEISSSTELPTQQSSSTEASETRISSTTELSTQEGLDSSAVSEASSTAEPMENIVSTTTMIPENNVTGLEASSTVGMGMRNMEHETTSGPQIGGSTTSELNNSDVSSSTVTQQQSVSTTHSPITTPEQESEAVKAEPRVAEISTNCRKMCIKSRRAQKCAKCVLDNRLCCFGAETGSAKMAIAQYQAAKDLCFN